MTSQRYGSMLTSLLILGSVAGGCGKKAKATDPGTTTAAGAGAGGTATSGSAAASQVPQVGAISLKSLGASSASLALLDTSASCNASGLGVMGLALGPACSMAPLAANILAVDPSHDFDGDGTIACADFTAAKAAGKDPGLMLSLLCQPVMLNNTAVESVAIATSASALAVGFTAWPGSPHTPIGNWTAAAAATSSYPADIRLWTGDKIATLHGAAAISLTSTDSGAISIPDLSMGKAATPSVLSMTYRSLSSAPNCVSSFGNDNCHWQDVSYDAGEGDTSSGPNAAHLKIWADDKKAPTVIAVEGNYYYTPASAAHFVAGRSDCPFKVLGQTSEIYFQVVQKGGQVWGMFDFYDINHHLLSCSSGGYDAFALMAQSSGICQNTGTSSDAWVPCKAVSASSYPSIWSGEATFTSAKNLAVPTTIFAGAPTADGICLSPGGCRAFKASDIE